MTKQCTKCGRTKPTSDFYHKSSASNGISSWCKECELVAKREYHKRTYVPHPKAGVIDGAKKKCSKCGVWKPFKEFAKHKRGLMGLQSVCRECTNTLARIRYSKISKSVITVKDKVCALCRRQRKASEFVLARGSSDGLHCYCNGCAAARRHNLTALNIERMLQKQGNQCAICNNIFTKDSYIDYCIDHCHITGNVRGLLCRKCNSLLGFASDNLIILQNAVKYLKLTTFGMAEEILGG